MESQLPISAEFPEDQKLLRMRLYDLHQRTAFAVNGKVGGLYVPIEKTTGAQYYDTANTQKNQNVYRMTLYFTTMPATIAHGINWTANTRLVQCYGAINNTTTREWLPLPNQTILVTGDSNNVMITSTVDYSAYTDNSVVIEYRRF